MGIEALAGETAIETSAGAATVNAAEPLMVPEVAVIVAAPCAAPVARPAALMLAFALATQVTELVRFCVVPSV